MEKIQIKRPQRATWLRIVTVNLTMVLLSIYLFRQEQPKMQILKNSTLTEIQFLVIERDGSFFLGGTNGGV